MTIHCEWEPSNGRLPYRCVRRCRYGYARTPDTLCNCTAWPCVNVGEETGKFVSVECIACNKEKTLRHYPIHRCNVFGECLPTYTCTKDALSESMDREIATCRGCEKFEPLERNLPATGKNLI